MAKKTESKMENVRHSLSHLLAMAVLKKFPKAKLGIGPAIENGFYYDFDGIKIGDADLSEIEKEIRSIIGQNFEFKKRLITFAEAKKLFANQPYKLELIKELNKNKEKISIYKTSPVSSSKLSTRGGSREAGQVSSQFTDLCAGPHVESTKKINPDAFKLAKTAGAYWRGDEKNKMLTRIYGVAFETQKELEEYLKLQEEAEKRDHKKLGKELNLLMFHETAPGMPYWLPKGLILYKELENYWRDEHKKLGYLEIASPLVNKAELWKISGHWDHYKDDMFIANMGENEVYGIKPMNCPNAMVVFKSMQVSYKDLPLRLSDTDRLHRYELSGTLNGLLRCRSFQQDDSHNYITEEMIESEYESIMEICKQFYNIFNLEYRFRLGTRPENFMGDKKTWDKAEKALKDVLKKSDKEYSIAEGDGAFYGPKIDIIMKDALGRDWQMGTMQLDFQQPKRFGLEYIDKDGSKKTPVVIHRVIYGSLERFIGILIEHFAGAFPLWLSPVQAAILPISDKQSAYAEKILEELKKENIRAEIPSSNETLGKRIREAEMQKTPYILVVGDKEIASESVAVRQRGKGDLGALKLEKLIEKLKKEISEKSLY